MAVVRQGSAVGSRPVVDPAAWWRAHRSWLLPVSGIFLLSRCLYLLVATLAFLMLPEAVEPNARHFPISPVVEIHWRWDAIYYYAIAAEGYRPGGLTAFFPLLPLLTRALALPVGLLPGVGSAQAILIAGLIVPNVAGWGGLLLLYRLVRLDDDHDTALRAALYLAFFPLALYFIVPYTEALLLLTSVGCFLALRHRRWLLAGGCGLLAALSRQVGILLMVPFAWELGQALWHIRRDRYGQRGWRTLAAGLVGLSLIPLGLGLYMAYLFRLSGDPLSFATVQRDWDRAFILPPVALWEGLRYALEPARNPTPDVYGRGLLHTGLTWLFLGITLGAARHLRPSYTVYGAVTLLVLLSSGMGGALVMHSNGRMVMLLFPVFIVLARWGRRRPVHLTIVTISASLFALCTALFVRWYPVA